MFIAEIQKVKTSIVLTLTAFSILILIACGTGDTAATDVTTADDDQEPLVQGLDWPTTVLDPSDLYTPPEGIQTITLPEGKDTATQMRFSKGSGVHKDKADVVISPSTKGFFFLCMAERSQGGVLDMGALSDPIDEIEAPESGYMLGSKVEAIEGHTYAVKARDDEPGHFIIVRVKGFGEQPSSTPGEMSPTITIDFFYKE